MQVTGSNRDKKRSTRLSIRIPNGQSLHRGTPSVGDEIQSVDLTIGGCEVVPFPAEVAEMVDLEAMFAAAGISLGNGDEIATTHNEGAIRYAIKLSQEAHNTICEWRERGLEVLLHTPLEGVTTRAIIGSRRPKTVVLQTEDGVAYVAVSVEHKVCFVEALPIGGEEQMVNLLAHINQDFNLGKARFILLGESSKGCYKTIKKYFRRVRCEK